MIELERHIEILLLSNDCVIVPELGGFMTHHVCARYDDTDNMFLPPLRTLGFNPQLTMNDSLLAQSYVEAYDISYPEALRRIESEVSELRQHLENEGFYELNDLGVLRMNSEGHMEFEPCEAGILTPALYGLSSFEMKPYEQQKNGEKQSSVEAAAPKLLGDVEQTAAKEDVAEQPTAKQVTENNHDGASIVIKMSWLRNAAAMAAAILLFFMIQTPVSNSVMLSEMQQSSIVPVYTAKPARKTEPKAEKPVVVEKAEAVEAEARDAEDTDEPFVIPAEELQPVTTYCIVLASQTTQRHAEDFVKRLKQQGHDDARIIDMQNTKKVRVVCGSYVSEDEAYDKLRELHKQKEFAEAWLMTVK